MKSNPLFGHIYYLIIFFRINHLLQAVTDEKYEKSRKAKAIKRLGNLGHRRISKAAKRKIVKALILALADDAIIRMMAAESLARFGETQWKTIIKGTLDDFEKLAQIKDERINEILINALSDFRDQTKQMSVVMAMGKRGNPEFAEPLINQFSTSRLYIENQPDSQMSLGELSAIALSKLSSYYFNNKTHVVNRLKKYLLEFRPETRKAIAITLSKLGEEKWLEIMHGDSQDYDRVANSGDPQTVRLLTRAMGFAEFRIKPNGKQVGSRKKNTHNDAKRALSIINDPALLDALITARQHPLAEVREAVVNALGNMSNPLTVELLMKSLTDKVRSVREEAAKALLHIALIEFSLIAQYWKKTSGLIQQSHHDHEDGDYEWSCEFHSDTMKHTDTGIGLKIPPELMKR